MINKKWLNGLFGKEVKKEAGVKKKIQMQVLLFEAVLPFGHCFFVAEKKKCQ